MKFFRFIFLLSWILISGGCSYNRVHKPILILYGKNNFGLYTKELLRTEGFMEYEEQPFNDKNLSRQYLKKFDLVILTENALTDKQRKYLSWYIRKGGKMIFFKPDANVEDILGIKYTGQTIREGYFKIDTAVKAGRGMPVESLQYHGEAEEFRLNGAAQIAALFDEEEKDTGFPAVTVHSFGKGKAAAILFNLPESVVYLHQGNPAWKGQERDGVYGLRNLDLFVGRDGEKNWLDKDKVAIPQADEQVRLLSHVIEYLNSGYPPLPRLWYFPGDSRCVALLTCDGENNGDPDFYEKEIDSELKMVQSKGGHMTVYLIGTGLKPEVVERWKADGNEIAIHYDDTKNAAHVTRENMDSTITVMQNQFREVYGNSYPLSTVRNHWIVWYGWAGQAAIEQAHGIQLDCNSYKYDNSKDVTRPDWIGGFGYFTGSGIPMKFADEEGNVLDIYQSETQIVDEQLNTKGGIYNGYRTLVDRSLYREKYAVVNAVFHPNSNANKPYLAELEKTADYCRRKGVPMLTAMEWLDFLKARDSVKFNNLRWYNNNLSFAIHAPVSINREFGVYVPGRFGERKVLKILVEGKELKFKLNTIKGNQYAFFKVFPGSTMQVEVQYRQFKLGPFSL